MSNVDTILEEARSHLKRLEPHELHQREDALIVDIRPIHNRLAEGEIENSVVIERIVLEWRLDPAGDWRLPGFDANTTVVVVCNEGWASSLAARDLQRIGLVNATDLAGGYRAWRAAGLPTREGGSQAVV